MVGGTIVEMSVYCTGDWDEAKRREPRSRGETDPSLTANLRSVP